MGHVFEKLAKQIVLGELPDYKWTAPEEIRFMSGLAGYSGINLPYTNPTDKKVVQGVFKVLGEGDVILPPTVPDSLSNSNPPSIENGIPILEDIPIKLSQSIIYNYDPNIFFQPSNKLYTLLVKHEHLEKIRAQLRNQTRAP